MTTTTTRTSTPPARPSRRTAAGPRGEHARRAAGYPAVDGANALQLGYPDLAGPVAPSYAEAASPVPAEQSAPAPLPVALPRAPFVLLMVGIVALGVLGVLVLNTKINENSFRLDNLRSQQATLDLQEQQLDGQLADRESAGSLSAAAARLGLVPAGTPAFLNLPDGRVVGVPQPAHARSAVDAAAGDPGR